jgi:hypothetical protein
VEAESTTETTATMTDTTPISQMSEVLRTEQINGGQLLILLGGVPNYGPGQVPKDANFGEIKLVIFSHHFVLSLPLLSLSLISPVTHRSHSLFIFDNVMDCFVILLGITFSFVVNFFFQKEDYRTEQAIDYYKSLSFRALEHNIEIDIFCGGLKNFQIKVLQNLVISCGGSITLHKEFATEFFNDIGLCILKCTHFGGYQGERGRMTLLKHALLI